MPLSKSLYPDRMTADQRKEEIAGILSRVFLRQKDFISKMTKVLDSEAPNLLEKSGKRSVHGISLYEQSRKAI